MIIAAAILFLIAAFFGSFLLRSILYKHKKPPIPFAFTHGIFAIFGLLVAIAYTIGHPSPLLITGVVILVFAAMGGLTMLMLSTRKKPIPIPIAIVHPIVAITGLIIVLVYIYQTFLV